MTDMNLRAIRGRWDSAGSGEAAIDTARKDGGGGMKWILIVVFACLAATARADITTFDIRSQEYRQNLTWGMSPIYEFDWHFDVPVQSVACLRGHIDTRHRYLVKANVFVAFKVKLDGAWLAGSTTGENITLNRSYYAAQINVCTELQPGQHRLQIFGRSASSAAPGRDGLAEIKPGYNQVTLEVHELW